METLVKAYNICVTMVAQGHRHQLSIPPISSAQDFQNHIYFGVKLFGETVPPNKTQRGGTVPPNKTQRGGTVEPNKMCYEGPKVKQNEHIVMWLFGIQYILVYTPL